MRAKPTTNATRLSLIALLIIAAILVTFFIFENTLLDLTEHYINGKNSLYVIGIAIVVLLAADVVLPTPSSLLSLAAVITFDVWLGGLIIFTGMSLCCLVGYSLGYTGHRLAKHQLDSPSSNTKFNRLVNRWGVWALLISRPVPVLAETAVVMAGVAKLPLRTFLIYTLPANALVALAYGLSVLILAR